jgi:Fis family transcriptional regulator, factor for inversion stimulation protein
VTPVANKPAALADACRTAVRRYLAEIKGHPPAQLHRLIMAEVEKPLLLEVLLYCEGNLTHAAEMLGMNRATLRKKLDEHNITH